MISYDYLLTFRIVGISLELEETILALLSAAPYVLLLSSSGSSCCWGFGHGGPEDDLGGRETPGGGGPRDDVFATPFPYWARGLIERYIDIIIIIIVIIIARPRH